MLTTRQRLLIALTAALFWAIGRAGVGDQIVNANGWPSFARFWRSIADPETSTTFLRLTWDAAVTTLAYAVLGTVLAIVIGAFGALATSELLWGRATLGWVARGAMVVPRAVHEIIWALLLVQVLGFDPLVAVIAIGVPFGAVTAKVFAETIDEADPGPYRALRANGASRISALAYGVLPQTRGEFLSYSFYRFECSIRSAAVLGVIGVGGLGFQLDLSFESLRYNEIWTLIAALMVLSGGADFVSARVRRHRAGSAAEKTNSGRWWSLAIVGSVALAWRWSGVALSSIWDDRTRRLAGDLIGDLFPPRLGPGGYEILLRATVDTLAMSIIAIAIAAGGALVIGALAARPVGRAITESVLARAGRIGLRVILLLLRAVPAPIWAFLFVLILFPGMWPGAVALGVYNLGVVGRLFAETFEERDAAPSDAIVVLGAGPVATFLYGTLPSVAPRLTSLALYRWEVIARETVVVGVVGAGGLGQLIRDDLAARDYAAITGDLIALVILTALIDMTSSFIRRRLRS